MKLKGTTSLEFEVDPQDVLMQAYLLYKESIGREGWAFMGEEWWKSNPREILKESTTKDEIEKDAFFDSLFKFVRGETP